jgi:hypothetical protein
MLLTGNTYGDHLIFGAQGRAQVQIQTTGRTM